MRQFMITIMTLTAFGALAATAQAETLNGGPTRNGDQCFKHHGFSKDSRFGYWEACPGTTAAATTPRSTRRNRAADSVTSPASRSVNGYEHESAQ
jgi:hypothetical protein